MAYEYHPELQELLEAPGEFPGTVIKANTVEELRGFAEPIYEMMRGIPVSEDVAMTDFEIPMADGCAIRARWYVKKGSDARSAVMYVHGGGQILMGIDEMNSDISRYVLTSGVPFLSIDYRLAPGNPRPLAEDAFDSYLWMREHAGELGIDAERIAIMGDSGGACVAAGAAILARDRRVPLAKQILIYPMLDDRTTVPDPELEPMLHGWSTANNVLAWKAVLGDRFGTDDVLPCEAPARNNDFSDMAPAFIEVGEIDAFRNEAVAYALGFMKAHVLCELHVIGGVTHTFDTFPMSIADKAFEYRSYVISLL